MTGMALMLSGTSPRMRGKLRPCSPHGPATRNIPAYAGKTLVSSNGIVGSPEHPRVCGENHPWRSTTPHARGTSPRMRGKPQDNTDGRYDDRNIPAYAGKTMMRRIGGYATGEHPRVCGENVPSNFPVRVAAGTSPRMRGKPWFPRRPGFVLRNIPAYAGKTNAGITGSDAGTEHPRVCGENLAASRPRLSTSGTSPRMRGKPASRLPWTASFRNIPAYAGKTRDRSSGGAAGKEHPRVCGENVNPIRMGFPQLGTSPRMRGKPKAFCFLAPSRRNIPAYAGKTSRAYPYYRW